MTQKELETIANKNFWDFFVHLKSLKPSELAQLELYLYRNGKKSRANDVLVAGLGNCGDEYYDY